MKTIAVAIAVSFLALAKDLVSLPKANVADARKKTHRCENGQWLMTVNYAG